MENLKAGHGAVSFGVFEFHAESHVLYRKGVDSGLDHQPARLLGLLLTRPNEIVSRQEMRTALWPPGTSGDLDDRINHAIKCIREALHDRQEDPQYIETIPKRGYRFIGHIQRENAGEPSYAEQADLDSGPPSSRVNGGRMPVSPPAASHAKRAFIVISIAAAISLCFVTLMVATRTDAPVITYVSPIRPRPDQTIVIRGRHLGRYAPYSHTDSPWLAIRDNTAHWAAGRIMQRNFDGVMLTVAGWKDSEIIITAFTGMYGHGNWKLNPGDAIEVAVWDPETGAGPARFHLQVAALEASR